MKVIYSCDIVVIDEASFYLDWRFERTMGSKKVKHMQRNTCRVIKIEREALFELIYETMIDGLEEYFDLLDCTVVTSHHKLNPENGEYICLVIDDRDKLPDNIDIDDLLSKIPQTTTSLYSPNRYKEITFDEIRNLLGKSEE